MAGWLTDWLPIIKQFLENTLMDALLCCAQTRAFVLQQIQKSDLHSRRKNVKTNVGTKYLQRFNLFHLLENNKSRPWLFTTTHWNEYICKHELFHPILKLKSHSFLPHCKYFLSFKDNFDLFYNYLGFKSQ
jgi:hypothetical protein